MDNWKIVNGRREAIENKNRTIQKQSSKPKNAKKKKRKTFFTKNCGRTDCLLLFLSALLSPVE